MKILLTGGAGFIGSHASIELIEKGYDVVVLDNLSNSSIESIKRINKLLNCSICFYKGDVCDKQVLIKIFKENDISGVIHFAGLKAVGESFIKPEDYYLNNVVGSINLSLVMKEFNCKVLIFSSSATVYDCSQPMPLSEDSLISPLSPYGSNKIVIENYLRHLFMSDKQWSIGLLRYFNPVGAHISGMIGESPNGIPNNLMPYISQVACGKRDELLVFGCDYDTKDGTGVRDYIHVVDLAKGHVRALEVLIKKSQQFTLNLGTGNGYSVLEMVNNFELVSGKNIKYKFVDRRPGDVAECFANSALAEKIIGWKAKLSIDRMCEDTWRWQLQNPNGY